MTTYDKMDRAIFLALNFDGGPFLDSFFYTISNNLAFMPIALLAIWMICHSTSLTDRRTLGWRRGLLAAAIIILAVIAADQVCNLAKYGIGKLRPSHNPDLAGLIHLVKGKTGGLYGTFSAHAATVFTMVTASSRLVRKGWFTFVMLLWAVAVCYSRIYLGKHYLTDIIYGAAVGVLFGMLSLAVYARIEKWVRS